MDSSIRPTKYPDVFLASTTDFFYPNVDDPFMQGKIACANVLSDLYAIGVVDVHNLLMLLSVSTDMPAADADISTKLIIKGFNEQATAAGTMVTGGQTVKNPWPIIGGVAMSTVKEMDLIRPEMVRVGDKLILTKPIGTQIVVNLHQWLRTNSPRWAQVESIITKQEVIDTYEYSIDLMARLNRGAARLMHKYHAHAATDITGFGLIGHATNLAKNQPTKHLGFQIESIPIIKKTNVVGELFPFFRFSQGFSAETSGGLLIAVPAEFAQDFCRELEELENEPAFIIGSVTQTTDPENSAFIVPNPKIIEVDPTNRCLMFAAK